MSLSFIFACPDNAVNQVSTLSAMEGCINEAHKLMLSNGLMLDHTKTELMVFGSCQQLAKVNIDCIRIGGFSVTYCRFLLGKILAPGLIIIRIRNTYMYSTCNLWHCFLFCTSDVLGRTCSCSCPVVVLRIEYMGYSMSNHPIKRRF